MPRPRQHGTGRRPSRAARLVHQARRSLHRHTHLRVRCAVGRGAQGHRPRRRHRYTDLRGGRRHCPQCGGGQRFRPVGRSRPRPATASSWPPSTGTSTPTASRSDSRSGPVSRSRRSATVASRPARTCIGRCGPGDGGPPPSIHSRTTTPRPHRARRPPEARPLYRRRRRRLSQPTCRSRSPRRPVPSRTCRSTPRS